MANNKRALRFNKAFGYMMESDQKEKEKQRYTLTKERYFEYRDKLIRLLPKVNLLEE